MILNKKEKTLCAKKHFFPCFFLVFKRDVEHKGKKFVKMKQNF